MYKAPRGTADILAPEQKYWRYVREKAEALCQRFGYQRIDTPVFEEAGLFIRGVGGETDIVQKEMYTFEDKGGTLLALRPEGTAPVCRAYLEHGMYNLPQPVRLYYLAPIFRYERPQSGRYRQHHQFGVEVLGDPDPLVDAEVLELAWRLMEELGLRDLYLMVNSIGCPRCRPAYLEKLRAYYEGHRQVLCPDCKARLVRNPLRLLDCKQEACQELAREAPASLEYLCPDCRRHWEQLTTYLRLLDLPYQVNHRLVRGLDYYTRTVFEIQPPEGGSQSALCGGGRYDGLIQELGGKPTPGIGFGAGMERLVLNIKRQQIPIPEEQGVRLFLTYIGEEAKAQALQLAFQLRRRGLGVVLAPSSKSLKGQMRQAQATGVPFTLILGQEELKKGKVILRDMASGEQQEVPSLSEVILKMVGQPG